MKLHTVFITYNRLELTKRAIESYIATVSVPYTMIVVDNNSSDGTREWLASSDYQHLLLDENRYPGYACNRGFKCSPDDANFLHRADNDFVFLPGWCAEVAHKFIPENVGQVGLRTGAEEMSAPTNVGGNMVIRRALWDEGLRYDERPWPEMPPGLTEDSFFSPAVRQMGYRWIRVGQPCIQPISYESPDDPYYQETWAARRIYGSNITPL